MGTEQQQQSEHSDYKGATKSPPLRENTLEQDNIPQNQTRHTSQKIRKLLTCPKDLLHSYRIRQVFTDLRVWIEVVALMTVICYTRYAGQQSKTMSDTLSEIRRQTIKITESAAAANNAAQAAQDQVRIMQSGQRPWVGLDGQATLERVTPFRLLPISPPNKIGISCDIDETFIIHNYGITPAFDEHSDVMLYVPQTGETGTKPEGPFNCRTTAADISHGEVIFPGAPVRAGFRIQPASIYLLKSTPELRRIWLLGCISYRDGDRKIHNTKFWLRSTFPDGTAWIQLTPTFRYMPILGFESWGEEAN